MNRTRWIIDLEPILRFASSIVTSPAQRKLPAPPHVSSKLVETPRHYEYSPRPVGQFIPSTPLGWGSKWFVNHQRIQKKI